LDVAAKEGALTEFDPKEDPREIRFHSPPGYRAPWHIPGTASSLPVLQTTHKSPLSVV